MKQFKLKVHSRDFSSEDLVLNPKDFLDIKVKDVLEIYHPVEKFSRLLLQVSDLSSKEELQQNSISVDQNIAAYFQLRKYDDVIVNVVNTKTVALDSLELTFKDQYLERSDMWRIKQNLENSCVYLEKKLEFWGVRLHVYEMWSQGGRVTCGVVTVDTKIVYRSCTNLIYLFLQMSTEMWDMDVGGDLYFEKAINGFLSDLFAKWKKNETSHEVTIVLFSRSFYDAQHIAEFPAYMHSCLQVDYKGRFYEDFYRVVVQNERYEDWTVILVYLKKLFNNYRETVLQFHNRPGVTIPKAINSNAAQGNFLEVLNMSLNVFERHYQDRSFDRTGHLSVVITPGVGVFEVDRELTNITKQRIIDNGVGSDLVCLGEQPLHAVPLFKFHGKSPLNTVDDYSLPHWINLSFYTIWKRTTNSAFIPRIKLAQKKSKVVKEKMKTSDILPARSNSVVNEDFPNLQVVDYDEYDAQVFKHPATDVQDKQQAINLKKSVIRKKTETFQKQKQQQHQRHISLQRKYSETDISQIHLELNKHFVRSAAVSIPKRTRGLPEFSQHPASLGLFNNNDHDENMTPSSFLESFDEDQSLKFRVGSAGSPYSSSHLLHSNTTPGRGLINPFDPSHVTIKLTSNRRRWTHVFPIGPNGGFMQQHHYESTQNDKDMVLEPEISEPPNEKAMQAAKILVEKRRRKTSAISTNPVVIESNEAIETESIQEMPQNFHSLNLDFSTRSKGVLNRGLMISNELPTETCLTLIWGATGEQEWTPALTTGVDWKSCTIPACLPLTTDFFPEERKQKIEFVVSDYDLIPEYMNCDILHRSNAKPPLTTNEVARELVCQRLQQGFQLIVLNKDPTNKKNSQLGRSAASSVSSPVQPFMKMAPQIEQPKEEFLLSIGRIFHKLTISGSTITVSCLKPKHPYPIINIKYLYRFMAQHSETYEISAIDFTTEKLENFNWNYLDHYICTRGEGDFILNESLKYSRFRMFVLPFASLGTKRILEGSQYCDVYDELTPEEEMQLTDNFLQFVSVLNKIRKPHLSKKANPIRDRAGTLSRPTPSRRGNQNIQSNVLPAAGYIQAPGQGVPPIYRDRLDSNRMVDRPRPRNCKMERMRSESGNGGRGTLSISSEMSESKTISSSSLSLDTGTDNFFGSHKDGSEESTSPLATPRRLTLSSSMSDIIDAMKHSQDGLSFLTKTSGLPNMSFISAEATLWVIEHIEGSGSLEKACKLLQKMLDEDYICHCSGNPSHPFIHGFFFYHICPTDKELSDGNMFHALGEVEAFQREWIEVAFHIGNTSSNKNGPLFLQHNLSWPNNPEKDEYSTETVPLFKKANVEISINMKNDRDEWGQLKYHGNYSPSAAFEMILQWLVATGSFVTDLILKNWARRASSVGLLLVPVHSDSFAQPFSNQFDPLRGTIFIPLAVNCLVDDNSHPFSDFPSETWDYRLFLFQEAIVRRFGFLPCQYNHLAYAGQRRQQSEPQYVHTTGNAMLMISIKLLELFDKKLEKETDKLKSVLGALIEGSVIASPHEEYITRHVTGQVNRKSLKLSETNCRIGFLWSWNYTLSKRWKSYSTGDDQFMYKILNDFRSFCSNSDQRLRKFWDSCKCEMAEAIQRQPPVIDEEL